MAFITGTLLIDAPASALNNSGESIPSSRTDNTTAVKRIRAKSGQEFPYVSGQAQRYWLRNTIEQASDIEWEASPTYRGDKVSFSDGNPIHYWDDDLLGYMRAPGKKDLKDLKENHPEMTPQGDDNSAVTRVSPFRIGTLVSIAPVNITEDFGTMTRTEGNPVPHEHQFYRAHMHTMFAIDLAMAGTFTYSRRSGFQNLDAVRIALAEESGLTKIEESLAYQLPLEERSRRVKSLLLGLARLQGGAKQAIHYTDVSPAIAVFALVKGGNNPFNYLFKGNHVDLSFKADVLEASISDLVRHDLLLSPVCIGWKPGFFDEQRPQISVESADIFIDTPRSAFAALADYLVDNPHLMDA